MTQANPRPNLGAIEHPLTQRIITQVSQKILDKESAIKHVIAAMYSQGHVLLEDRPGLGKTTLATAMAQVFGMAFNRVQMTSDMMPSDLLGVSIYEAKSHTFHFHRGPIFTQFLLADELNRATPKTQSALLEAMAENQVSIDGKTRSLEDSFFVMATQNPLDEAGTYALPQSQLDRFLISLSLGYPDARHERQIYTGEYLNRLNQPLKALSNPEELGQVQQQITRIYANDEVLDYLQNLIRQTRQHAFIQHGLSPRAGLSLFRMAQSLAFIAGRDFVTPNDLQEAFYPVARHRLISQEGQPTKELIEQILHDTSLA